MRILLDENLNWRLARDMPSHDVASVPLIGWAGLRNGALLRRAVENGFEALITLDTNMVHQQNLGAYEIAVVVLRARNNRLQDTQPLIPAVLQALASAPKGIATFIG